MYGMTLEVPSPVLLEPLEVRSVVLLEPSEVRSAGSHKKPCK